MRFIKIMPNATAPQLLVSVRNAAEARAALDGQADLIDIKEPTAGSLGMASAATICDVVRTVGQARPVSAALGELADARDQASLPSLPSLPTALCYVKMGLAGAPGDWRQRLQVPLRHFGTRRFIATAYADYDRVAAPAVAEVLDWAITHRAAGLLIDTSVKDGQNLFHWASSHDMAAWLDTAHKHHLIVALAGSLHIGDVQEAVSLGADIVAVRGAVCADGDRASTLDATRVRHLKRVMQDTARPITRT